MLPFSSRPTPLFLVGRYGNSVRVARCGHAQLAFKEEVANSGHNLDESAMLSMRIGGVSMPVAGGDMSERVKQRGEVESDAYKAYPYAK